MSKLVLIDDETFARLRKHKDFKNDFIDRLGSMDWVSLLRDTATQQSVVEIHIQEHRSKGDGYIEIKEHLLDGMI